MKPADGKPTGARPAEVKPQDARPGEAKPAAALPRPEAAERVTILTPQDAALPHRPDDPGPGGDDYAPQKRTTATPALA
ncbi:hypothetical protein [Methylobrevis pamukkalensis]|uniref:Uncharacterized protein n=1 Tax=Methylobrevis pamukkalensis TaxID=1439726 RepID=A0A1E3H241_9HYPH|nr:hypothetical protein [Methylobrevis pamukkalensis]ODN70399.1 hypothetical protein A6302_02263 [Methylobrevis pamukkalensis]